MNGDGLSIPTALLGQAVLFVIFILVVNAVLREAARVLVRVALVIGLGLAIAVIAGWLDGSLVGQWLEQVGELLIRGIRALVLWLRNLWEAIAGAAGEGR